ncbi:MAG: hypothetical protein ACM3MN_05430, partial [Nitrospirota bacterium]
AHSLDDIAQTVRQRGTRTRQAREVGARAKVIGVMGEHEPQADKNRSKAQCHTEAQDLTDDQFKTTNRPI